MNRLIYKLFIVLNSEKHGSARFNIALMLLKNIDAIKYSNIQMLAEICNCSIATMSRFFRDLEYDDFSHYKDSIRQATEEGRYHSVLNAKLIDYRIEFDEYKKMYENEISKGIEDLFSSISIETIDRLAKDIHNYKQVAAFGLLHSQYQVMSFQAKMVKMNKVIISFQEPEEQKQYIHNANKDDLIMIFSLSGNYVTNTLFDHVFPDTYIKNTKAKIVLITSNREFKHKELADEIIYIGKDASPDNYKFMNNYYNNFITDLIAYRYDYLFTARR